MAEMKDPKPPTGTEDPPAPGEPTAMVADAPLPGPAASEQDPPPGDPASQGAGKDAPQNANPTAYPTANTSVQQTPNMNNLQMAPFLGLQPLLAQKMIRQQVRQNNAQIMLHNLLKTQGAQNPGQVIPGQQAAMQATSPGPQGNMQGQNMQAAQLGMLQNLMGASAPAAQNPAAANANDSGQQQPPGQQPQQSQQQQQPDQAQQQQQVPTTAQSNGPQPATPTPNVAAAQGPPMNMLQNWFALSNAGLLPPNAQGLPAGFPNPMMAPQQMQANPLMMQNLLQMASNAPGARPPGAILNPATINSGKVGIKKTRLPMPVFMDFDEETLTEYQCLLRQQIELFEAEPEDVKASAQGRNNPILLGQVGIRCRHCTHLPLKCRPRGAVYYSRTIDGLYQVAQNMSKLHFCRTCNQIPRDIRSRLSSLQKVNRRAAGGKEYWSEGLRVLGVYEDGNVMRFRKEETSTNV